MQIAKLQKHGSSFLKRAAKFLTEYEKTFKEGRLWLGEIDLVEEVSGILERFGIL